MDTVSKAERSRIMARVKSWGNHSTERAVVAIFRREGVVGWRRGYPLVGKPDFVFTKSKIALFIDGCLWHGCGQHCRVPMANRGYWKKKIAANIERAFIVKRTLSKKGWMVERVWEHEIKNFSGSKRLEKLRCLVLSRAKYPGKEVSAR